MGELIQQVKQIWDQMDLKKRLLFGGGILGLLIFSSLFFRSINLHMNCCMVTSPK